MFSAIFSHTGQRNAGDLTSWVKLLAVSGGGFHEPDTLLSKKTGSSAFTFLSPYTWDFTLKLFLNSSSPPQVHCDAFISSSCAGLLGVLPNHIELRDGHGGTRNRHTAPLSVTTPH